ncbi:dihydrofolate reductase [Aquibacillus koreensis]|uniref:Dihydrofolate reductase n=1 Tax=Aquibacillus koreensis TaxID=279446 RepID=A0A9X4AGB2_9BACI|nr:dihydrofolate reductase [Aquibacillus koreensis]MCT2537320.1 dihydrofolate reductase [Aquibacillus koreensis]MDC3418766.1 dihydrofolate reductase [Aquibacillus koreensis]
MISLLFAMDQNRVIGYKNDLPWRLPNDLKFFKNLTTSNNVIMGRKTFDSMNGPLPNRENIVITRDESFQQEGCEVIHSIDTIVEWDKQNPEKEFFVIGGGNIFEQILPYADRMYMTYIEESFPGDTYFPAYNEKKWTITNKEKGTKDEKNPYDYYFIQYDRV